MDGNPWEIICQDHDGHDDAMRINSIDQNRADTSAAAVLA